VAFLDGITVLDLASVGPAARTSRWLSDFGASVVKVGPVPAHGGVQLTPPFHAYSGHRGMERVLLDLKAPAGVETFLRLASAADVVIESFRPGVADRLGVGFDAVRSVRPSVVYCSTTGYGQHGPRAQWAGHDLNYQGVSGYLDLTGRDGSGQPPVPGATLADGAGGGLHAVASILAALIRARTGGEGAYLDVAAADGMLALMALPVDEFLAEGTEPGPGRSLLTGRYACYGVYRAADGWLTVAAIEPRFWTNLCSMVGLEHWATHQFDDAAQDGIRGELAAVLMTRTRDEWVSLLGPADTCVAPVLSVPEVTTDAQYRARGCFVAASHPAHGAFTQVAPVLAGMDRPAHVQAKDSSITDTQVVLGRAGIDRDTIDSLIAAGVVA